MSPRVRTVAAYAVGGALVFAAGWLGGVRARRAPRATEPPPAPVRVPPPWPTDAPAEPGRARGPAPVHPLPPSAGR